MKVLIIDDDNFIRTVCKSELVQENVQVELAEDGEMGLELAKTTNPDLILLDMILPKKNGFIVLKELGNDPELKKIPVIVFSCLGQKSDIDEALALGAKKYLTKDSCSPKQVVQEINKILMQ